MAKVLYAAIIALVLVSCYTTRITPISEVMDEWLGSTEHEVILKVGPPTTTTSDGNEGKVLIYENSTNTTLFLPNFPTPNTGYAVSKPITRYVHLYVNKEGIIYSWRTNYPDIKEKVKKHKSQWPVK